MGVRKSKINFILLVLARIPMSRFILLEDLGLNRAIKQLEDREGKEQFWKPKSERATGKKKITRKMMDDFLFVANGKTIMLPEGTRVFKIRGENFGEDGEQIRDFILQHGKKDNFKDSVSNLIQK